MNSAPEKLGAFAYTSPCVCSSTTAKGHITLVSLVGVQISCAVHNQGRTVQRYPKSPLPINKLILHLGVEDSQLKFPTQLAYSHLEIHYSLPP